MTAYLKQKRFNDCETVWDRSFEHFLQTPELHDALVAALEEADAWHYLEQLVEQLVDQSVERPVEQLVDQSVERPVDQSVERPVDQLVEPLPADTPHHHRVYRVLKDTKKIIAGHQILISRKKEDEDALKIAINNYRTLITNFEEMPLPMLVIIAEFLLKQNDGKSFLDISTWLLNEYIDHQLESVRSTDKLAQAYHQLALQQDQSTKGILTTLSSLSIAWILTNDQKYFKSMEALKSVPAVFQTAFAEIDITPKVSESNPVSLQGMAGPERKATGVSCPLKMQILLIEDENHTKMLFVSADLFGFGKEMVELVRNAASGWGIPAEGIILNASHTHYGPGTLSHVSQTLGPYFKEYAFEIAGIIGNSLTTLYDNLEPSHIYFGKTDIRIGVNRRLEKNGKIEFYPNDAGSYDQHTPFLLLEQKKSCKHILMINHGCHPTGLGVENNISADFPGYLREELINTGKVNHVMYLQGASGDIKESSPSTAANHKQFARTSLDAQENGRIMARQIIAVCNIETLIPLTHSNITSTRKEMYLPLKQIPDINQINELKNDIHSDPVISVIG